MATPKKIDILGFIAFIVMIGLPVWLVFFTPQTTHFNDNFPAVVVENEEVEMPIQREIVAESTPVGQVEGAGTTDDDSDDHDDLEKLFPSSIWSMPPPPR